MTGKERILTALAGGKTDVTPVGIDYMTLYLAERTERAYVEAYRERLEREGRVRISHDEDIEIRARATLQACECFQERHDWLQVPASPSQETSSQRELLLEDGQIFELDHATGTRRKMLLSGQETKTQEMRDRFEQMRRHSKERTQQLDKVLAEYRIQSDFALLKTIVRQRDQEYFVYTGAAAPFWLLYDLFGFEGMMTALHDAPRSVFNVMDKSLETTLAYAQAFKDAGGDGIRVEECLASADMISPQMYEQFVLPYEERLFTQLCRIGLKTILYFCGDVTPRLPALRQLPIDALMVEESKKNFTIDIAEVRAAVGAELCLLGNIDSYAVVQKGTDKELATQVARQIQVAGTNGAFIVGVGSPLPLDTPPEQVDKLVRYAHECSIVSKQ